MIIFIQARFNSNRLPGKVLMNLAGKPMLQWTIERLKTSIKSIPIAVITSDTKSDDVINSFCHNLGIKCYRGDLNNVAIRFRNACKNFGHKEFIRICGDSPLIDPCLIQTAINLKKEVSADIITNLYPRTFPKGQSVEIVSLSSIDLILDQDLTKEEKEHVTIAFYKRFNHLFNIYNFSAKRKIYSNLQLSVDTKIDFDRLDYVLSKYPKLKDSSWLDIANVISRL